jgi:hypothetical protein
VGIQYVYESKNYSKVVLKRYINYIKIYFYIVLQSSTVGHTELTRIVSYYRFLNTDPGWECCIPLHKAVGSNHKFQYQRVFNIRKNKPLLFREKNYFLFCYVKPARK